MDIIAAFIACFILLVGSVSKGIFVGYPITICLFLFALVALKRGNNYKEVIKMAYNGGKKSYIVVSIFIIIGAITGIWMAAGTVPAMVYYGMMFLKPKLFILSAFLISSIVSLLIGTSLGTVGTAGLALIVVARGGGVNPVVAAGAIIAGIYLGDRCSPMSSSANLVAVLTETDLYENIKNMIKTSAIPFILSIIIYTFISFKYPLTLSGNNMSLEIVKVFNVGAIVLLPALVIFILSAFKVNVKLSMVLSIAVAILISVFVQHNTLINSIKYMFMGYYMDNNSLLQDIMKGGGVISMLKASYVVFVSSAFTGVFEGASMLKEVEKIIKKAKSRHNLFIVSIITSLVTSAFGCTQTLAVILTHMLVKDAYEGANVSKAELASDLENTAIVIAAFIPWNIALLVPLTTLGVGAGAIMYAVYLYLIPIVNLIQLFVLKEVNIKKSIKSTDI